jgi:hypothetical protein
MTLEEQERYNMLSEREEQLVELGRSQTAERYAEKLQDIEELISGFIERLDGIVEDLEADVDDESVLEVIQNNDVRNRYEQAIISIEKLSIDLNELDYEVK